MAVCLDYQVVYRDRARVKTTVQWEILAGVVLFCALAFKVWVKLETTNVGYSLARAKEESVKLDMERRELLLQQSVLKRPDIVSKRAATTLSLRPLDPEMARKIN